MKHPFLTLLLSIFFSSNLMGGSTPEGESPSHEAKPKTFIEKLLLKSWPFFIPEEAPNPGPPSPKIQRKTPGRLAWEAEEKKYWDDWKHNVRERARQKYGPLFKEKE